MKIFNQTLHDMNIPEVIIASLMFTAAVLFILVIIVMAIRSIVKRIAAYRTKIAATLKPVNTFKKDNEASEFTDAIKSVSLVLAIVIIIIGLAHSH